ncbi:hypothetical protein MKZ38_003836 [Zalerion maritima]|uniref:Glycosyltransferase family 31 protein n=1 Tax=Zalerion maritima TaxID=339359 RepID=A0AAD5RN83_9PEZI|nr:hypothetical protein MKZ38_003836 [Zalerion maritima]
MAALNPHTRTRRRFYFLCIFATIFILILSLPQLLSIIRRNPLYAVSSDYRWINEDDEAAPPLNLSASPCAGFPNKSDMEGILLVMKTGATEAFDKLPTQLLTSLQCFEPQDFLLFSDMDQQIGPYLIHDALDTVAESIKAHNSDFDLYRSQRECPISQKACLGVQENSGKSAWRLDKYKFLHVMVKTWDMRPGMDWYVFAEADTYIFWNNLVRFLKGKYGTMNPKEKLYMGSVAMLSGRGFAHGGSGYVLSGAALKRLMEGGKGVANKFDQLAKDYCCGDALLSMAMEENGGTTVKQLNPHFNGETPSTIRYGLSGGVLGKDGNQWCEPIFTMHHMNSEEVMRVWKFDQERRTSVSSTPSNWIHPQELIQIKDLYKTLVAPQMDVYRPDWDNLSNDVCYENPGNYHDPDGKRPRFNGKTKVSGLTAAEKVAYQNFENCAKVCEQEDTEDLEDEYGVEIDEEAKELAELMLKGEELKREREGRTSTGQDGQRDEVRDGGESERQKQLRNRRVGWNHQHHKPTEQDAGQIKGRMKTTGANIIENTASGSAASRIATATPEDEEPPLTEEEQARAKAYLDYQAKKQEVNKKRREKKCFQYRWHKGVCCTSSSFTLGVPKKSQSDDRKDKMLSGWDLKGINDWIEAIGDCEPLWREGVYSKE